MRTKDGHYSISGMADPSRCPNQIQTRVGLFKLSRVEPSYVLYQEVGGDAKA